MKLEKKQQLNQRRRWRIRKKVAGTADRPRLTVRFTHSHIYAQCIDDEAARTLVSGNTTSGELKGEGIKPNVEGATRLGGLIASKAKAAGIEKVVFDRNGRRYHGCVKAFADAAREGGLSF